MSDQKNSNAGKGPGNSGSKQSGGTGPGRRQDDRGGTGNHGGEGGRRPK